MCRFPGCAASRHLHAHHAIEWDDDGPTDLDNLLHLCGFHHRFVHRAGWRFVPLGRGRFDLLDAGGHHVPEVGGEVADPFALQPPWWDGARPDIDLCVQVLRHALDRRPRTVAGQSIPAAA